MKNELKRVEEFWDKNLCGSHFIQAKYQSKEFFEQYRKFRYEKEHHLNHYIDWESAKNKDVLEIGVGMGADGTRWAQNANKYVGIDLTSEAVLVTNTYFNLLGLRGYLIRADSELLPFSYNSFDICYSHGVLHHTPDIRIALTEINRVLKPNGKLILMLYTKNSFNYWIRIQFYFRSKFLFELFKKKLGLKIKEPWETHISNVKNIGWSYFSWRNWPHHCTDGPNCPIANIYYKHEIKKIIKNAGFKITQLNKAHFPLGINQNFERYLANYLGFFQFVWAIKIQ